MNKQLLALSLIASPALIAQDANGMASDNNYEQNGYCNVCCCRPCCCKPCCVPKPKKCIDCECYTPAYYDLQCDCGFFVDVAFLYWYARETNLSYALELQSVERTTVNGMVATPGLVFAPQTYQHLDTKWDPGVRVGVGWNDSCDGWDYYLNWTWFKNSESDTTSVPNFGTEVAGQFFPFLPGANEFALLNPWINTSFHAVDPNNLILTWDRVKASWRITFNQIDLEVGRKYWLSKCFTLRPYTGLRGAWTKTRFRTRSSRNVVDPNDDTIIAATFKDRFKTKNWGVGLLGGIQPNFFFCSNFILYGNLDFSLIWGEFEVRKKERYVLSQTLDTGEVTLDPDYSNISNSDFFQMNAIFDLGIGLRWEESWCCDQYRTALDLGWEHHIWLDHNHRNKTYDFFNAFAGSAAQDEFGSGFRTYDENTGNLCYGGLVIRLRVDF